MTLIEVVEKLQKEGHQVKYRVRTDGGIIITEINGTRYSGASGNAVARNMVGATLSEARKVQLETIKPEKGKSPESRKLAPIDEDLKKEFKKMQRKWKNKVNPKKGKKTLSKLRWDIQHLGQEEARRRVQQAVRYANGVAYSENIQHLIDRVYKYANEFHAMNPNTDIEPLLKLADDIKANESKIKESDIYPAYAALYGLNDGEPMQDVVNKVRTILKI